MCGIAGFAGSGARADLARMTRALAHRGPDAEGLWQDEARGVYLGHRRLSIIDLGGGGQPMWSADGKIGIVFNGEIYNHAELRRELQQAGRQFLTGHSDTEVLIHGYREWGDDFVNRLNGMWAFVIYDAERRRLFASRDRFGKKPFYYFQSGETFAFGSELTAMTAHPAAPSGLDRLAIAKYFAYGLIPAPLTMVRGIRKLPAGHNLEFSLASRELRVSKYWEYRIEPGEAWGSP
ncbi:MAG TPA: asparagine synthetase B, partial [Chthoniobacterales bacterium]